MNPRYSIGIDLGTTNCALAYADLGAAESESKVLGIRQLETENTEIERGVLPSFLYLNDGGEWTAGLFARERGREVPERVVHSAKSWLCHHSVSPQANILPWKSKFVEDERKISPIAASARLLEELKKAWEECLGAVAPFSEQLITVTVPASFDAAAQAATLEAAKRAGFPEGVRLLEEPQSAFYRWLEGDRDQGRSYLDELVKGERILVVDIGGGTSDFSLFEVGDSKNGQPLIERVSVSEHLLLGGDNIDLALAHALESELAPEGEELNADQWGHLLSRARELKETCLAENDDRPISVSLPSKGAGLFAGTLSTEVSSQLARDLILEGFFPECSAGAKAERAAGGLLEMGLPYAVDCAVTRHLAEFLGERGRVDRVLFNGGSLAAPLIQQRLLSQFGKWQSGREPAVLDNAETDLAVARGAAVYGASFSGGRRRIEAGTARAIFLEVETAAGAKRVCVLPKGAQAGERFEIEIAGLRLAIDKRVRFQTFQGSDSMNPPAGIWCGEDVDTMRPLPALDTKVESEGEGSVPVRLRSGVNELGLLQVRCESLDTENPGSWPLEFNLRETATESVQVASSCSDLNPRTLAKAEQILKRGLTARGEGAKASRILKEMEAALGSAKHEWSLELCRALSAAPLMDAGRWQGNPESAESWLQLTGFLLRPGFGAAGDEERLANLAGALDMGECSAARVEVQRLVLLRRVAAGFGEAEQARVFDEQVEALIRSRRTEAERMRLLGSLEKVDLSRKGILYETLFERLEENEADGKSLSPVLAGFGGLLSRVLFCASEDRIMPPDTVEKLFKRLGKLDWTDARYGEAIALFLRAGRLVEDRSLNVSRSVLGKIVAKLEKSRVAAKRLKPLRDYQAVTRSERIASFGEALPPGLLLSLE